MACECDCGHHHDWDDEEEDEALRVDLANRPIAPLPLRKRQRLSGVHVPIADLQNGMVALKVSQPASQGSNSESSGDDGRSARDARAAARARERASLAAGSRGDSRKDEYGNGGDEPDEEAWDRWVSKPADPLEVSRDPDRVAGEAPDESTKTTNSLDPGSTTSESPPTSPALSASHDGKKPVLFGDDGQRIVKSLASANSFSPAGLFGGLGLATLHPSLAPSAVERHFDEDEDGDEDSYGVVDRTRPPVEPSMASQVAATALGLGESNKKKRKIPGLNLVQAAAAREGDAVDDLAPLEASTPTAPGEFKPANGPLAPPNPPTTAEAALAKLRVRPPHVSLCDACISARRSRRKRSRVTAAKQPPLALPDAPAFVPPAMPKEGPPPLPPGSGLKGSKAIKLAMKAAKEREKEKERIRKLFSHVRVTNLYDPDGTANPPPSVVTRAIKADLDHRRKEGVPDGDEDEVRATSLVHATPRALDLFVFSEPPPPVIESRWTAVNDQKERLKAAKERATRAREEEERRRRDKEERERVEAAVAAEAPPPPPPVPAPPAAPARTVAAQPPARSAQAALPRPAGGAGPAALPPVPTTIPSAPPSAPPPASALPSPPPPPLPPTPTRKPAAKKGRKKRSAHANALNVHHRDNYIPSRLPSHTPTTSGIEHDANGTPYLTSWPASEEALASAGPYASTCGAGHFCGPDEWLCLFCEYELFYGEESLLYRAIRRRHNVLKVRKKAKDRATKATQGAPGAPVPGDAPSTSHAHDPPREDVEDPPLEDVN